MQIRPERILKWLNFPKILLEESLATESHLGKALWHLFGELV